MLLIDSTNCQFFVTEKRVTVSTAKSFGPPSNFPTWHFKHSNRTLDHFIWSKLWKYLSSHCPIPRPTSSYPLVSFPDSLSRTSLELLSTTLVGNGKNSLKSETESLGLKLASYPLSLANTMCTQVIRVRELSSLVMPLEARQSLLSYLGCLLATQTSQDCRCGQHREWHKLPRM